ncbi:MAG: transposase [Pyrinomonadaceae bacterium]|nr:transposase [Pyrinomonadaceae bacterium]
MKTSRQIYCQYLLSSQINYTCTNLADHTEGLDHTSVYRYLKGEDLRPALVWERVKELIVQTQDGYLLFDDTVLDKSYSFEIDGVRRQYSGNAHGVGTGIGIVNLVYYNAACDQFWIIDYRLFDPQRDGKTKLDHLNDMLDVVYARGIRFRTVLMDTWYATTHTRTRLIKEEKIFYCPLKKNRLVDESKGARAYQSIDSLAWTPTEEQMGKTVKVKGFAQATYLKLFRVVVSPDRTDYIVTNDMTQSDTTDAQQERGHRWKVEQFHREEKQLTGIGDCECRINRSQRNHLCCAMLVWVCLKNLAYETGQTVYQLKHGLLSDYLRQQLRGPTIAFS